MRKGEEDMRFVFISLCISDSYFKAPSVKHRNQHRDDLQPGNSWYCTFRNFGEDYLIFSVVYTCVRYMDVTIVTTFAGVWL